MHLSCSSFPLSSEVVEGKGVLSWGTWNRKCELVLSNCHKWSCYQVWAASDWSCLLSPRQIFPSLDPAVPGQGGDVLSGMFLKAGRWVKLHSAFPMQWNFDTHLKQIWSNLTPAVEGEFPWIFIFFFSLFWMRRGTELLAKVSWRLWTPCVIKNSIRGKWWQTSSAKGFLAPGRENVHHQVGSLPVPIIQEELSPSPHWPPFHGCVAGPWAAVNPPLSLSVAVHHVHVLCHSHHHCAVL